MAIPRDCPPTTVDDEDRSEQAALFKALANRHRLTILATLARAHDEVCVCDLTEGLPTNQPTVSDHLRVLREAGLVTCDRRGTWVYYTLAPDARKRITAALSSVLPQGVRA